MKSKKFISSAKIYSSNKTTATIQISIDHCFECKHTRVRRIMMTQEDRTELLFAIFSAGYEKSVHGIPLEQAFKEFLQEVKHAEQEMIKNGYKITL